MSKDTVVIFTPTNAVIKINPEETRELLREKNAIINPDLHAVRTCPPHFWKMEYGQILPMTKEEQEQRLKIIDEIGIDNRNITGTVVATGSTPNLYQENLKLKESLQDKHFEIQMMSTELLMHKARAVSTEAKLNHVTEEKLIVESEFIELESIRMQDQRIFATALHKKNYTLALLIIGWVLSIIILYGTH